MSDMREHPGPGGRSLGLAACLAAMLLATACAGPAQRHSDSSLDIHVLEISPADYHGPSGHPLQEACRSWTLSTRQVESFFQLSDTYPEVPYSRFYQVGCGISGQLRAEGRRWTFAINGGGTATWHAGGVTRYFGCSISGCSPLLLLPSDGMEPD